MSAGDLRVKLLCPTLIVECRRTRARRQHGDVRLAGPKDTIAATTFSTTVPRGAWRIRVSYFRDLHRLGIHGGPGDGVGDYCKSRDLQKSRSAKVRE
jgi:hypothetical protein